MKKISALLIIFGLGLSLTACTSNKTVKSTKKVTKPKSEYVIRNNKEKAAKKLENTKNISLTPSASTGKTLANYNLAMSMQDLKQSKPFRFYTFSGQVLNWHEIKVEDDIPLTKLDVPHTKLEVKVDKSFAGTDIAKDKVVDVVFPGGYAKYGNLTAALYQKYGDSVHSKIDKNKKVFWEDQRAPVPKIGSKVIFVTTVDPSQNEKNLYLASEPGFRTWVYNKKTKKYELNSNDLNIQKNDEKFTEEINHAVGK